MRSWYLLKRNNQGDSRAIAIPIPPPMHMVAIALLEFVLFVCVGHDVRDNKITLGTQAVYTARDV